MRFDCATGARTAKAAGGLALAATALGLIAAAPAWADSTLTVKLGGEGFNGPPAFSVSFDGKLVGQGVVDTAIDTSKAGRFADAADRSKYVKSFSFAIPDAAFKSDGVVAVSLTNPAHGAPGSKDDRQLYVQSVTINGDTVAADSLAMRSANGVEPTAMLGDYLVISEKGIDGIALPASGWPKPAAAAAAPATPTAAASQVASAEDSVGPGSNPNPEAGEPACGLTKSFQVLGFHENSNDLTPRVTKALDAVVEAIGTQQCAVRVTGYSSTEGDFAHNALFSIERAQNALHYLSGHGVKFRKFSANGVGETTQFGASPNANRRVVVTVSP